MVTPDNPFIIQNISTEWNSIRNFYKMDKFWHLMVCMIVIGPFEKINTHSVQGWPYHPHLTSNAMMNLMSGSNAMSHEYLGYRRGYISYRFSDMISIINDVRGLGHSLLHRHSICNWPLPLLLIGYQPPLLASDWWKDPSLCLIHHLRPTSIEGN